jgi:16S rRNA (guanine966-N2)-methyltransferase
VSNRLRIIGGRWRSRVITFPDGAGLRPTHDRIRETVFNWLAPVMAGAACLDAFAGSGALGFEALSRDAKSACFVESNGLAVASLKENIVSLKAADADIIKGDFFAERDALSLKAFDVVFLDPPYHQGLLQKAFDHVLSCLSVEAWVYWEQGIEEPELVLPEGFEHYRQKKTSSLRYGVLRWCQPQNGVGLEA